MIRLDVCTHLPPRINISLRRYAGCDMLVEMDSLPTLDDVYQKFGFASEAAQLLETELGTLIFGEQAFAEELIGGDGKRATEIMNAVNRQTLGALIKNAKGSSKSIEQIATLLEVALKERNRLSHSFYRQHNFRRNSGEGRAVMLQDLETIHTVILEAYKQLMLLGGTDLDAATEGQFTLPKTHVKII